MLEKLLADLHQAYVNNSEILQELSNKTKEFEVLTSLNTNDQEPGKQDNELENLLSDFVQFRTKLFQKLKEEADRAAELQNQICLLIGCNSFTLNALKPNLSAKQFQEFSQLTKSLMKELKKVLELDKLIIPSIEKEMEGVKLELHRLQGAKKTKNAYENQGQREARFIDKTK